MSLVNVIRREIALKIVFYGPPLSGKSTTLTSLHGRMPDEVMSGLTAIQTGPDRFLFFDFLYPKPDAATGFSVKFQLYTVAGEAVYAGTRRLLLRDADGIVFVADSQWSRMEQNCQYLDELRGNLAESRGPSSDEIPLVLQYNKRDLPNIAPAHYMDTLLNHDERRLPFFETVATTGEGLAPAINMICQMTIAHFGRRKA